jgi:hypothetical protein
MERDINNYDYLSISIKSERLDKIMYCYKALGWREEKREEDRQYYDMKYLLMSRPHNIQNKDRLHYLQVRMENKLNYLSRSNAYRHRVSTLVAIILTVLGVCLLALGLYFFFGFDGVLFLPFGIAFSVLGLLFIVAQVYPFTVMRKKESTLAEAKISNALKDIEAFVKEAEELYKPNLTNDDEADSELQESE